MVVTKIRDLYSISVFSLKNENKFIFNILNYYGSLNTRVFGLMCYKNEIRRRTKIG